MNAGGISFSQVATQLDDSHAAEVSAASLCGVKPAANKDTTWGRIVFSLSDRSNVDLKAKDLSEDTQDKLKGLPVDISHYIYTLGRRSNCDICMNHPIISQMHCRIYCTFSSSTTSSRRTTTSATTITRSSVTCDDDDDYDDDQIIEPKISAVWIVDSSSNGTWVNDDRLLKDVPRQLHGSDFVSLLNPILIGTEDPVSKIVCSREVYDSNSFSVLVFAEEEYSHRRMSSWSIDSEIETQDKFNLDSDTHHKNNSNSSSCSSNNNINYNSCKNSNSSSNMNNNNIGNNIVESESNSNSSVGPSLHKATSIFNNRRNIYDHYNISKVLGDGATSVVKLAIERTTGIQYAVKIISFRRHILASNAALMQLGNKNKDKNSGGWPAELTREAEMMRLLRHKYIIYLEDVFMDDQHLYFVLEYTPGGDLLDRILKKIRYSESEAKIVMKQIFEAVCHMHSNRIIHRDLKPENILLSYVDSDIDIKVSDFGMAKKEDDGLKTFVGTVNYWAPEVEARRNANTHDENTYTLQADIWSLGIIMFVLLSGSFPASIYKTALPSRLEASVSPDCVIFLAKCLEINPDDRFTALEALKHPWLKSVEVPNRLGHTTDAVDCRPRLPLSDSTNSSANSSKSTNSSSMSQLLLTSSITSNCDSEDKQSVSADLTTAANSKFEDGEVVSNNVIFRVDTTSESTWGFPNDMEIDAFNHNSINLGNVININSDSISDSNSNSSSSCNNRNNSSNNSNNNSSSSKNNTNSSSNCINNSDNNDITSNSVRPPSKRIRGIAIQSPSPPPPPPKENKDITHRKSSKKRKNA